MIVRLKEDAIKPERRRLLGDVVYVIFHDALKRWQKDGTTTLSPVELFLSAKAFSKLLMELPDVMEGLDDEMDDLVDEAEGENDAMIIMMLASAIIYAAGTHRVGFETTRVIMAIYTRGNGHPLFPVFMDEGAKKEQARWLEGKKTNLLTYELEEIEKDGEGEEAIRDLFERFIAPEHNMGRQTLKENLLFLNKYNIEHGHAYDKEILAIYKQLSADVIPAIQQQTAAIERQTEALREVASKPTHYHAEGSHYYDRSKQLHIEAPEKAKVDTGKLLE